jgi:hypothetical protein
MPYGLLLSMCTAMVSPVGYQQQWRIASVKRNDTYLIDSPWRSPIIEYLERRAGIELLTSEEILEYAIKKPLERQSRADQMQVASILKDLGWVKKREATGRRRWHYVRSDG